MITRKNEENENHRQLKRRVEVEDNEGVQKMGLNSFVQSEPRALPIFVLADTSGSMYGEKIEALNRALRELHRSLNEVSDVRGRFQLCVISFGGEVRVECPLADVDRITLTELTARGNTPMGAALDEVCRLLEDRSVVSARAYAPTIVLISGGVPTDCPEAILDDKNYADWAPLRDLHRGERSSRCQRLALGLGADADYAMLKEFIRAEGIPVLRAADAEGIAGFFRWVAMSTVARMNSSNPNETDTVAPLFDIDDEDMMT